MARRATPPGALDAASSLDDLLVRSGGGDRSAFAELYDHLAPRVFGLVTCLVHDLETAERVTSDAFVDVWRRAATYDPAGGGAAAWVLGTVRRLVVPASRAAARPPLASPTVRTHDRFLRAAGLTGSQADAVHLAWYDGLDHRRIDVELRPEESAAALITGGLRTLASVGPR